MQILLLLFDSFIVKSVSGRFDTLRRSRFDTHLETKDIRQSENIIEFILLELPSDTCGAFPWSDVDQYQ